MSRRSLWVVGVAAVCLACESGETMAARTAHEEFGCPPEETRVAELGDDRYRVSACGNVRIYECRDTGECMRDGFYADRAVSRASREFGCPRSNIQLRWIQRDTYRVEGCKQAMTYDCEDGTCAPEGPHQSGDTVVVIPVRIR